MLCLLLYVGHTFKHQKLALHTPDVAIEITKDMGFFETTELLIEKKLIHSRLLFSAVFFLSTKSEHIQPGYFRFQKEDTYLHLIQQLRI